MNTGNPREVAQIVILYKFLKLMPLKDKVIDLRNQTTGINKTLQKHANITRDLLKPALGCRLWLYRHHTLTVHVKSFFNLPHAFIWTNTYWFQADIIEDPIG